VKIGIVAVPFFSVNTHRAFAELTLSTITATHELFRIAVVNRYRPEKGDIEWINSNFDSVHINDQNNLARAWNLGIREALQASCNYVAVINLDIIFHADHFDNLVSFAEANRNRTVIWSGMGCDTPEEAVSGSAMGNDMQSDADFCAFMIDSRLFELVGTFDELFKPAYHEDRDMKYRTGLAGLELKSTQKAVFYHVERGTQTGLLEEAYSDKSIELFGDAEIGELASTTFTPPKSVEEIYADSSMALFGETVLGVEATLAQYIKKWGGAPGREKFKTPYNR